MPFDYAVFMKSDRPLVREYRKENDAIQFRKKVYLTKTENAKLYVCGLGFAYYYINGKKVSEDLFTAPVSNYNKTLWYNVYDVSHLLQEGENTFAVICGNGWYNESMSSDWFYHKATWRDVPKVLLRLAVCGETVLVSDDTWKCKKDEAIYFNQLRNGEYFDARKYDARWNAPDYDDSGWESSVRDVMPPAGTLRECVCEPIREHEIYPAVSVRKSGENKYLFDIGQNISGYIRLETTGKNGGVLTIRYAEAIGEDLSLKLGDIPRPYQEGEMMTDRVICSGEPIVWSPIFTYHGFRYIEIEGLMDVESTKVSGVFVHQDIKRKTFFSCSDPWLNRLFDAGVKSVYSNMFYQLTDCPTREKLGWTNDAQASTGQILLNFHAEMFFKKWYQDILDAQMPDGALPGIVPTSGWGYAWGNGPVSDGVLFEIPYRMYLHTGCGKMLKEALPYMKKYLAYLERRADENGFVSFGLDDWSAPFDQHKTPIELINASLMVFFYRVAELAARLAGEKNGFEKKAEKLCQTVMKTYIDKDGTCRVNTQTALALLIYFDLYENLEPLKEQLHDLIKQNHYHHDCGMVGIRRLYTALDICGLQEVAYKILSAEGVPGYRVWFENGATTLWERWQDGATPDSRNHHMYSGFMAWLVQTVCGLSIDKSKSGEKVYLLAPYILQDLTWAECIHETSEGELFVRWEKEDGKTKLSVRKPKNITLLYQGKPLQQNEIAMIM